MPRRAVSWIFDSMNDRFPDARGDVRCKVGVFCEEPSKPLRIRSGEDLSNSHSVIRYVDSGDRIARGDRAVRGPEQDLLQRLGAGGVVAGRQRARHGSSAPPPGAASSG